MPGSKNSPLGQATYLVKPLGPAGGGGAGGGGSGTAQGFKYNPSSQRNLPQQPRTLPQTPVQQTQKAVVSQAQQRPPEQPGFSNAILSKAKNVYAVNSRGQQPSATTTTTRTLPATGQAPPASVPAGTTRIVPPRTMLPKPPTSASSQPQVPSHCWRCPQQ